MAISGKAGVMSQLKEIQEAIVSGDLGAIASIEVPQSYRGMTVHADEVAMFDGLSSRDKDPRRSLHLDEVPTPELGPGEALVAVMASAINYNTVWTSIFEPLPTFKFLRRYGKLSPLAKRHDLPYHVVGSDAAGVVLRTGPGVHSWKPGDEVVAHCLNVELEAPDGHNDTMLDTEQRIWGFETNFGGLAEIALVKANQLMPKPAHLTWEEAACPGLVNSTAYRQLVSRNGADMKQGDIVLIWGASGGLGSYATQYALNGGAIPVCVVSSPRKAELCRKLGAELVIDRSAETGEGYRFWSGEHTQDPGEWQRFGAKIRELTGGEDPDIVFEHPGRETFGASVYAARRGGTIVTCASTSGYLHQFDNRYLWMNLKRIIGSHFANYRESWEANRLIAKGLIHPTLSRIYPLEETGQAALDVHHNRHQGKVGVLCLAPEEGLGVRDERLRARHLDRINAFRGA
ncbi:crotonyl-CoA reductase [Amycolatopsis taiwanensis]|uniref:Crotonyl-CoA reductase n=2 Tax=Amycolatopsis taiwanensis TaxID=342230 RepID=A0A9W6R1J1_9PSEU|nr:crotonyl-CoA reductase [Amycolatopsis taiwanensis]